MVPTKRKGHSILPKSHSHYQLCFIRYDCITCRLKNYFFVFHLPIFVYSFHDTYFRSMLQAREFSWRWSGEGGGAQEYVCPFSAHYRALAQDWGTSNHYLEYVNYTPLCVLVSSSFHLNTRQLMDLKDQEK